MWFVVLIVGDWLLPTVDFPSIHHAIPKYSFKSDADTWVFKGRFPTLQNPKHGKKKTKKSKKSKNNDNELLTNPQVKSRDQGMGSHRWLLMAVEDLSRRLRWIMFPSSCLSQQNIPPDLSQCVFVIEQALSVRALQELVTAAGSEAVNHFIHSLTHSSIDWPIHSLAHSFIQSLIHSIETEELVCCCCCCCNWVDTSLSRLALLSSSSGLGGWEVANHQLIQQTRTLAALCCFQIDYKGSNWCFESPPRRWLLSLFEWNGQMRFNSSVVK